MALARKIQRFRSSGNQRPLSFKKQNKLITMTVIKAEGGYCMEYQSPFTKIVTELDQRCGCIRQTVPRCLRWFNYLALGCMWICALKMWNREYVWKEWSFREMSAQVLTLISVANSHMNVYSHLPQEGITKDPSFRLSQVGKKIKKTSRMLETD